MKKILYFSLFSLLLSWSCGSSQVAVPTNYAEQHERWKNDRLADLMAPTGWLSLVGLTWLADGVNTCGSATDAAVKLPAAAPATAALYTQANGTVSCEAMTAEGVSVSADDPCQMRHGSLRWYLIERAGNHGIRMQDTLLPTRIRLRPIPYFPLDPDHRVAATWQPAKAGATRTMRNVLDMEYDVAVEGTLRFELAGQQHELLALDNGPDELFLIFSDETTGETTYGGGRYLYCPRPDAQGQTIIDFNRAENPPCAFTKYATCLLPLPDNHMPLTLEAGEKSYADH